MMLVTINSCMMNQAKENPLPFYLSNVDKVLEYHVHTYYLNYIYSHLLTIWNFEIGIVKKKSGHPKVIYEPHSPSDNFFYIDI